MKEILRLHKEWLQDNSKGKRADLSEADLSNANLSKADLSYATLSNANLFNVDLSYANLSNANLSKSEVSYANLFNADLSNAKLSWANLYGVELLGADLKGATLSGTNLSCIKGKTIYLIGSAKHFGYYCDGLVTIGCITLPVEEWTEQIGIANSYLEEEIAVYMDWIRRMK